MEACRPACAHALPSPLENSSPLSLSLSPSLPFPATLPPHSSTSAIPTPTPPPSPTQPHCPTHLGPSTHHLTYRHSTYTHTNSSHNTQLTFTYSSYASHCLSLSLSLPMHGFSLKTLSFRVVDRLF
ncbi:hypothetical protein KC19_6G133700 [Ceratodon purpureus]|uniref:Uncharacterized protein n=1 Tax=Ceratodon purpureus TaxID=3225 RepID=A0A8T0HHB6_CERPU|nr:hypothetical protein KC19_6G133700 [Ceratodon purpureus]